MFQLRKIFQRQIHQLHKHLKREMFGKLVREIAALVRNKSLDKRDGQIADTAFERFHCADLQLFVEDFSKRSVMRRVK